MCERIRVKSFQVVVRVGITLHLYDVGLCDIAAIRLAGMSYSDVQDIANRLADKI